ncbi:MAG TPA: HTH domain-containing protein [Chitinophagales bacterium]|nr:HTH domain-containing protein [Chitinophagales bacterium]
MRYIEYSKKLQAIKDMAEHRRTGTPRQLAEKLEVSERTAERMVEHLRDSGVPITYNRYRSSYEINEK